MHASAKSKGTMIQKMFIPLIPVVAVSASEAKGSSGGNNRGASVVALSAVPVPINGRPRVGNLVELMGLENTGDDKSKCHKRNFVMSETLM